METTVNTNQIELRIVFNGQSWNNRANVHQKLRPVFQQAIAHFGLQPTSPDDYGLFMENSAQPLDLDARIQDLNLPDPAVLLLQRRTPPRGG